MRDVTLKRYIYSTYLNDGVGKPLPDNADSILRELSFLTEEIKHHDVSLITGSYKGTPEEALFVIAPNTAENFIAERAFKVHNQDSYLVIHSDDAAELVYYTGEVVPVGYWTNIPKSDITKYDSWSKVGVLYYTTIERTGK